MYELVYLPSARHDLLEIVQYISKALYNLAVTANLAEKPIAASESIPKFPYANPVYNAIRPLRHDYRNLLVDNYLIFYWVDELKKQIHNFSHHLCQAKFLSIIRMKPFGRAKQYCHQFYGSTALFLIQNSTPHNHLSITVAYQGTVLLRLPCSLF